MGQREPVRLEKLTSMIGTELGISSWIPVEQSLINAFAEVTGDLQFIHVDPKRAVEDSPFGGTIAHGFLSLSLLSQMARSAFPDLGSPALRVNYGFDKVRFLAPVPSGARIRGRFCLLSAEERSPGELTVKYGVKVELENHARPALVAEWISRIYPGSQEDRIACS